MTILTKDSINIISIIVIIIKWNKHTISTYIPGTTYMKVFFHKSCHFSIIGHLGKSIMKIIFIYIYTIEYYTAVRKDNKHFTKIG